MPPKQDPETSASNDATFLAECFKHLENPASINIQSVADALGYKNPRSVANRLATLKKKYSLAVTTTTSNGNSSANTPTNTPKKTPKKAETTPKSGLKSSATVLESSSDDEDDDEKKKETEQDRGSPISKKRKVSNAKVETRLQSPFNETEKANTETPESKTEVNGKDNNDTVEDEVEHAEPVEPEAKTFSV